MWRTCSCHQPSQPRLRDVVIFVFWVPAAVAASVLVTVIAAVTSPWWLKAGVHHKRRLSG